MITSKVTDCVDVLNHCLPIRSLHTDNAALLSHFFYHRPTQKESDESKAISPSALRNDIPSRAATPYAWYCTSIVDAALVAFFLDHDTVPPCVVTTHPVVLRLVSMQTRSKVGITPESLWLPLPPYVMKLFWAFVFTFKMIAFK
jgi:hypothetical protein